MSAANEIRGVIAKWSARGYIEPGLASDIADDLIGVARLANEEQSDNDRRIQAALDLCDQAAANPGSSPTHWAEQIRAALKGINA